MLAGAVVEGGPGAGPPGARPTSYRCRARCRRVRPGVSGPVRERGAQGKPEEWAARRAGILPGVTPGSVPLAVCVRGRGPRPSLRAGGDGRGNGSVSPVLL